MSNVLESFPSPTMLAAAMHRYKLNPPPARTHFAHRRLPVSPRPKNITTNPFNTILIFAEEYRKGVDEKGNELGRLSKFSLECDMIETWRLINQQTGEIFLSRCKCNVCGQIPGGSNHPWKDQSQWAMRQLSITLRVENLAYLTPERMQSISAGCKCIPCLVFTDFETICLL